MNTHVIYYITESNGRAKSEVSLADYKLVGTADADSVSMAARYWVTDNHRRSLTKHKRPFLVGDLIRDPSNTYYIYTPAGRWATVSIK